VPKAGWVDPRSTIESLWLSIQGYAFLNRRDAEGAEKERKKEKSLEAGWDVI
jgi:hypothetical protein